MPLQLDTVEANADTGATFDIEEVQLQFQLQSNIIKLLVRNNYVYLILSTGMVYRIDLDNPEVVTAIQISLGKDQELRNAWIDKFRYHLILKSSKNEYFYIHYKSNTYKVLSKLKNLNIDSICFFDECVTETYTGPILASTTNSLLLEYAINSNKETLLKSVMKNKYSFINISNSFLNDTHGVFQYLITMSTTDNRILSTTTMIPSEPSSSVSVFQNLSKSHISEVKTDNITNTSTYGKNLAYITNSRKCSQLSICKFDIKNKKLSTAQSIDFENTNIRNLSLTKYYILLLTYNNTLEVYNQLNLEKIASISLDYLDNMTGISFDELSNTYWLYSNSRIYEILIDDDKTGIYKTFIDNNMFDEALKMLSHPLSAADTLKYNFIMRKKGYSLLEKKQYKEAAKVLAKTDTSFDRIALKLFDLPDKAILRYYLSEKLKTMSSYSKIQKNVLSSWIIELYIEELNFLDKTFVVNKNSKKKSIIDDLTDKDKPLTNNQAGNDNEKIEKLKSQFYEFLLVNKSSFDKETVYQIIRSHNRNDELLYFANLIEDFQFVLKYYITQQKWDESMKILAKKNDPELIYKCATVLMVNSPVKTVDLWIRLVDNLNVLRLMPALLTYNKNVAFPANINPESNQALRFLKFMIYDRKNQNKIIHNTFFSTLITYPDIDNENLILKYMETYQSIKKKHFENFGKNELLFDYDFILRLCSKFNKIQSAIYLYSILGKKDEAVRLALDNDLIDDAILVADKPSDLDEFERKKLWLTISEKLITKAVTNKEYINQNVKSFSDSHQKEKNNSSDMKDNNQIYILLKFLTHKCEYLTIKDLLPLFPDFVIIDDFKEALVESLKKLSLDMNRTSKEMDITMAESEKIGQKITDFQETNFQIIEPFESCKICHKILTIRKFIVFPCSHAFHQDCLVRRILESNDYKSKNAIYKLQKKIVINNKNPAVIESLKLEIDQLLSKSCCLCSEMKINELEEPLIKTGDKEVDTWNI